MTRTRLVPALAPVLAAMALTACSSSGDGVGLLDDDSVIFLAQTVQPNAVMEALFDGTIQVDGAGCPRLEGNGSTVVWPYGATLTGGGRVRDAEGRLIGKLGGHFRFGGGHVPFLHEGMALDDTLRARATADCPGSFWVVGDTNIDD